MAKNVQRYDSLSFEIFYYIYKKQKSDFISSVHPSMVLYFSLRKAMVKTKESRPLILLQIISVHCSASTGRLMKQEADRNGSKECRRNLEV